MEPKTVAEITLQGTLQEFLTFVQSFSFENGRIQVRGERDWVSLELMTPYAGHRYQQIGQFYKLRWDGHARGSVVQLPNGKALLRLGMAEGAWESLTPLWQELTGLLKKYGFLDSTADKATEQTGQEKEGLPITEGDELLTDREREIARLLAQGKSQSEIAKELVIEQGTVRTYKQNIAQKWNTGTSGHKALQIESMRRGYA